MQVCSHLISDFNTSIFKLDGVPSYPGLPPGATRKELDATAALIQKLRTLNPKVFISLSTGTWASVFFLTNIVVIMFVLVLAAFSVVGVPYEDLSDRMSTTMTLMLTIVAFKFVISGYIPPTPYLTLLDKYILTAYILISTVMFENFVVAYVPTNKNPNHILQPNLCNYPMR